MAMRYYNITLFNKITEEKYYFQLFEKNDLKIIDIKDFDTYQNKEKTTYRTLYILKI